MTLGWRTFVAKLLLELGLSDLGTPEIEDDVLEGGSIRDAHNKILYWMLSSVWNN